MSVNAMSKSQAKNVRLEELDEPGDVDWDQLRMELRWPGDENLREKLVRKIRENPFVPIGAAATVAALGYGIISFNRGNQVMSQYMMRARVGAQAFTIAVIVAGMFRQRKKET